MARTLPVPIWKTKSQRTEYFAPYEYGFNPPSSYEEVLRKTSIEDELDERDIAFIRAMFPVRSWFSRKFLGKEYIP